MQRQAALVKHWIKSPTDFVIAMLAQTFSSHAEIQTNHTVLEHFKHFKVHGW